MQQLHDAMRRRPLKRTICLRSLAAAILALGFGVSVSAASAETQLAMRQGANPGEPAVLETGTDPDKARDRASAAVMMAVAAAAMVAAVAPNRLVRRSST